VYSTLGFIWALIWFKETKDKNNDKIIEMFCLEELIDGKKMEKTWVQIKKIRKQE
jgi:hypothetical protein